MTIENHARRGRPKITTPHPVDLHVGRRVKAQRQALGLSQDKLGKELGLTFQQVQKYERGMNRVSASRLFELGRVLHVDTDFFFKGLAQGNVAQGFAEDEQESFTADSFSNRETMELVCSYNSIGDMKVRRQIFEMVKTLAAAEVKKAD